MKQRWAWVRERKPLESRPLLRVWESAPVYYVQSGEPLFRSAAGMVRLAEEMGLSLGRLALAYESQLLGVSEADVMAAITEGTLKAKKIGSQYRITKAAMDAFLTE